MTERNILNFFELLWSCKISNFLVSNLDYYISYFYMCRLHYNYIKIRLFNSGQDLGFQHLWKKNNSKKHQTIVVNSCSKYCHKTCWKLPKALADQATNKTFKYGPIRSVTEIGLIMDSLMHNHPDLTSGPRKIHCRHSCLSVERWWFKI